MAYALLNYTGDGSTTTFAISFPYIVESHVKVYVSGSLKIQGVDYNIVSSNVVFVTAPAAAAAISLRRNTSQDSRIAAFQDGVTLTQSALDTNSKYQVMEYGSAEFIANMIAELQDLRKRVAALEAK